MNKLKKGLAMVMAYFMFIALLPTGLFTVITKAAETGEVPQYLNYNGLYFNSVAQYGDRELVTYRVTEQDPNYSNRSEIFTQLSLFENEKETKVGKYEGYVQKYAETKGEAYYNYGFGDSALKYDFSTGTTSNIVDNQGINIDVKNDIVSKVNVQYNTNYSLQSSWINYNGNSEGTYDNVGNKYVEYSYSAGQGVRYNVIYNKEYSYITKDQIELEGFDSDNNLIIYDSTKKSIIKEKNNIVISEAKINIEESPREYIFLIKDDKVYTNEYDDKLLNEYQLKNGTYEFVKSINKDWIIKDIKKDSNDNIWFLREENSRNFVYKVENDEAVKKYEVAPFMQWLHVYDDNNLVVTSASGSTIISVSSTNNPIDTAPVISNENGTTNAVVNKIMPDAINITNIINDQKEVAVNAKDIASIKAGTGSSLINFNGNKINVPFSAIDKTLLDGATNVKTKYSTVSNSEIVKGLKAVNREFNLDLQVEYGNTVKSIHQFKSGVAEITLALTDEDLKGLDKTKIKVLYYNEETKKYETLDTKIEGNNIIFKTSHFSKFIVSEVDASGQPLVASGSGDTTTPPGTGTPPPTGDTNSNMLMLGVLALISLAGMGKIGFKNLKKNNENC